MNESVARILPTLPDAPDEQRSATVLHLRRQVERAGAAPSVHVGTPVPVLPGLADLLPDGALRRGTVVQVVGSPALALALAAAPVRAGAWAACVGLPTLGWAAAAASGWDLSRVVVVEPPVRRWSAVMASLVDAVNLVLVGPDPAPTSTEARRLQARARERGAVLFLVGPSTGRGGRGSGVRGGWSGLADVQLEVVGSDWSGIGQGWGHLSAPRLTVECSGRRGAARPRRLQVDLP
ncbi:MAG: hypothetical protein ACKO04_04345 [Actinomycetes bacterium]